MNIYQQISSNQRLTWVFVIGFVIFFLVLGIGFDHFYGAGYRYPFYTIIALVFALLTSLFSYYGGDKMILLSTHARPLDPEDPAQKQWQNVVEEMSIAAGIQVPATYIIEDPDPNAFATGRDPQHSSLAVTRGLLNALNREELQGVAAHEMSHIKNYDIRLMLLISVLLGSIVLLSDWITRSTFMRRRQDRDSDSGGGGAVLLIIWLAAAILAPLLAQLMAMMISRKREYLADASGAELTRNPMALAHALAKIADASAPTESINRGTAHLCIADPQGKPLAEEDDRENFWSNLTATHPPMKKRIAALEGMAYLKPDNQ